MSKNEYLRMLARELRKLPKEEFDTAMDYYSEYFEDAGPQREQEVIKELGTPREVASQIITDAAIKRMEEPVKTVKRGFSGLWVVILGICAAPIALPMAFALLTLLGAMVLTGVMVIGCAALVDFCALAGGLVCVAVGIALLFSYPATGLAILGFGMLAAGLGIFIGFVMIAFGKCIFRGIRKFFKRILKRRRK